MMRTRNKAQAIMAQARLSSSWKESWGDLLLEAGPGMSTPVGGLKVIKILSVT